MSKLDEITWVVIWGDGVKCTRCGERLPFPDRLSEWHGDLEKFLEKHAKCLVKER